LTLSGPGNSLRVMIGTRANATHSHSGLFLLMASALLLALQATSLVAAEPGNESVETLGQQLGEFCYSNPGPCRRNVPIRLRTEQDTLDTKLDLFWPVLHDGIVHLLPGEKLYLQVEWEGDSLRSIRNVPRMVDPAKTLVVEFLQREKQVDMILQIRNPFDFPIKYHADMGNFQGGFTRTNSCPVMPGKIAIEHWPHAITQLILSGLHRSQDPGNIACEY
jgi:hypothetical protein